MSSSSLHRTQALPTPHKEKDSSGGSGGRSFGRSSQENPWWQGLLGEQIDRWEVLEVLGHGGMSVVFKGQHQWLERQAAIKMLAPEFTFDDATQERFQQEARTLSRFDHPNILKILDFGLDPEHGYFMILELLKGQDLRGWMRNTPLAKEPLMAIFGQICEALYVTHQEGVVHRDLKPSNLFMVGGEEHLHVKILDFGVAKILDLQRDKQLTTTGMIMGTPAYLAPEQLKSKARLSPATDIYALGVILFEALCGRLPINGEDTLEHAMLVMSQEPPKIGEIRPVLKGTSLESYLAELLQKDPTRRPQDIPTFWERLRDAFLAFEDPLSHETLKNTLGFKEPKLQGETLPLAFQETHVGKIEGGASLGLLAKPDTQGRLTKKLNDSDGALLRVQREEPLDGLPQEPLHAPDVAAFLSLGNAPPDSHLRKTPAPSVSQAVLREELSDESRGEETSAALHAVGRKETFSEREKEPSSTSMDSSAVFEKEEDSIDTSRPKRWGLWLGVLLLVPALALGGWGWWKAHQKTPQHPSVVPPKSSTRSPEERWPVLLKEAEAVTRTQKAEEAIVAWKKLTQELQGGKSSLYPRAWLSLSQVYEQARWYHAAATELQHYLAIMEKMPRRALPSTKKGKKSESLSALREHMSQLRAKVQRQRARAASLFVDFRGHLEGERWLLAHAAYKRLMLLIPSVPRFQMEIGRLLQDKLPGLASWHVKRSLRLLSLSQERYQEGAALFSRIEIEQKKKKKAFQQELFSLEQKAKEGKDEEAKTRLLRIFEEKKPFRYKMLRDVWSLWSRKLMRTAPHFVLSAWEIYERELLRLREEGLWSWIKLEAPKTPSIERIREQLPCLRSHHQFAVALNDIQAALKEGSLQKAQEHSEKAEQAWRQFLLLDVWELSKAADAAYTKLRAQKSLFVRGAALEKQWTRAVREGRFQKARKLRGVLVMLMKGSPAQKSLQQFFREQEGRESQIAQTLQRADGAYRKKRWKEAHDAYKSYLRKLPKAWNRKKIRQRIKSCGCALGYPWVTCRRSDFPR